VLKEPFHNKIQTWRRHLALIGVARVLSLWTNMKKFTLLSLLALILMTSLLGCNAMRGAGKDISNTGKHIENIGK
jgi:predicted small secreted protein